MMLRGSKFLMFAALAAIITIGSGQNCPVNGGGGSTTTTLRDSTHQQDTGSPAPINAGLGGCGTALHGFITSFDTLASGKTVDVTVTGPVSSSRPQVLIIDILQNVVVAATPPSSQTFHDTFTSDAANLYEIAVNECAAAVTSGDYSVLVTEN